MGTGVSPRGTDCLNSLGDGSVGASNHGTTARLLHDEELALGGGGGTVAVHVEGGRGSLHVESVDQEGGGSHVVAESLETNYYSILDKP